MPTAPPTQVIVHRIELQKTERQYLEKYIEDQQKIKIVTTASAAVVPLLQVGAVAGVAWLGLKLWAEVQALLNGPLEDIAGGMVSVVSNLNPFHDDLVQIIIDKIGRHPKERLEDFDITTPEGQEEYRQAVRKWNEDRVELTRKLKEPNEWSSFLNPFD